MRRHELSDGQWELIADLMPRAGRHGGGRWRDHRQVVNGLMWKLCTGGAVNLMPGRQSCRCAASKPVEVNPTALSRSHRAR